MDGFTKQNRILKTARCKNGICNTWQLGPKVCQRRARCRRRANATSCSRCRSSADFVANSTRTRTATSPPRRLRFQAGVLRFQAGTLREQKGTALRQCSTQHASHANRVFLSYIHATRDRSHIVRMTYCNLRTNIVHTCEPLNCEPLNRSRLPRDAAAAFEHPT